MRKFTFILLAFTALLAVACVSERGDVLLPPKHVEFNVVSGKANFSTENISFTSMGKPTVKAGDYQNNPDAVFGFNPGTKAQMENVMTLSAGGVYEILVAAKHSANIYIKPVMEDCVITYKDHSQEYTIEISKNDFWGKVIHIEY